MLKRAPENIVKLILQLTSNFSCKRSFSHTSNPQYSYQATTFSYYRFFQVSKFSFSAIKMGYLWSLTPISFIVLITALKNLWRLFGSILPCSNLSFIQVIDSISLPPKLLLLTDIGKGRVWSIRSGLFSVLNAKKFIRCKV